MAADKAGPAELWWEVQTASASESKSESESKGLPTNALRISGAVFGRAFLHGGLHLGRVDEAGECSVSYGGNVERPTTFEVLCFRGPDEARPELRSHAEFDIEVDGGCSLVVGGWEADGGVLYVAAAVLGEGEGEGEGEGDATVPGKMSAAGTCNFARGDAEVAADAKASRVLCVRPAQCAYSLGTHTQPRRRFIETVSELLAFELKELEPRSPTGASPAKRLRASPPPPKTPVPLGGAPVLAGAAVAAPVLAGIAAPDLAASPPWAARYLRSKDAHVMLCHDMKGGYCAAADERYPSVFTSWDLIDVFVYFAHKVVAIPPARWVRECHANQVVCLGALVLEHESGSLATAQLLEDAHASAQRLAAVCLAHGFDGYLLNFESPLVGAEEAPNPSTSTSTTSAGGEGGEGEGGARGPAKARAQRLALAAFVAELAAACKRAVGEHALVVCYDSVDGEGRVAYQNALTAANEDLFAACDGLMTNYWWSDALLQASAQRAGARRADVFVGVDCFARGPTQHGPGPECAAAVRAARRQGLSVALFAPGWTLECWPPCRDAADDDEARRLDRAFWDGLFSEPVHV